MTTASGCARLDNLSAEWRSTAQLFREHEQAATAVAYEKCAAALEDALHAQGEVALSLRDAAAASGYSADHLGRLVREGKIPNAGRPGAPRITRGDLPRKPDVAPAPRGRELDRTQIVRSAIGSGD